MPGWEMEEPDPDRQEQRILGIAEFSLGQLFQPVQFAKDAFPEISAGRFVGFQNLPALEGLGGYDKAGRHWQAVGLYPDQVISLGPQVDDVRELLLDRRDGGGGPGGIVVQNQGQHPGRQFVLLLKKGGHDPGDQLVQLLQPQGCGDPVRPEISR